jgi:YD repeat-containing protein
MVGAGENPRLRGEVGLSAHGRTGFPGAGVQNRAEPPGAGENGTGLTDPRGNKTTVAYDHLRRVTRTEEPTGLVTALQYDAMGNVIAATSGDKSIIATKGYTTTASYYLTGLLREVNEELPSQAILLANGTSPAGTTTKNSLSYEYNRLGAKLLERDGNGIPTRFAYDPAGRLLTVTDAMGGVTEYAYDRNGNRTDVWDAEHTRAEGFASTHYTYDELNRLTATRNPLGHTTSQTYDPSGNLATVTEPRGVGNLTVTYTYDLGHRLTGITYPNLTTKGPVSTTDFVYDAGGRRLFRRDEWGVARYSYDDLGQLTRVITRRRIPPTPTMRPATPPQSVTAWERSVTSTMPATG